MNAAKPGVASASPRPVADRRVVLVTGATRGIGAELAHALADQGWAVVVTGRDPARLDERVARLRAGGADARGLVLRLDDRAALADALASLPDALPRLDALVLNAAEGGVRVPVPSYPTDLWQTVFQVNVHAQQALIASCHPLLARSPAGRVVWLSSGVARRLKPCAGAYAASKAALDALAGLYALETAGSTIRSNVVNPGPTRTSLRASAFPAEDPASVKPVAALLPLLIGLLAADPAVAHGRLIDADEDLGAGGTVTA